MNWADVFQIATAVIASIGGGAIVVAAASTWLGRVWAARILERDRQKYRETLEDLRYRHTTDFDVLMRRREVYGRMAAAMRVFLGDAGHDEKGEFLKSYDLSFLWASDEVVQQLGEFLDLNVAHLKSANPDDRVRLATLYADCLTAMRRDAGFPMTAVERADYRIVTF